MNGYRKMMMDSDDTDLHCQCYVHGSGAAVAVRGGDAITIRRPDGREVEPTAENIRELARAINEYYDEYLGYDDLHIACEAMQVIPCHLCPWFDVCASMDNPDDWEEDPHSQDYPDD